MKIAFVNQTPLAYTVETPYQYPLGGSESAMCYLAEALTRRGHDISLFTRIRDAQKIRGIMHIPDEDIRKGQEFDVLVVQNTPHYGKVIKPFLHPKTQLVLWLQHAHDQPAVSCLYDTSVTDAYSSFVCISQWQRQQYLAHFPLDSKRCFILRNAIATAFENIFFTGEKISMKKIHPPIIAYTSTPFRGLDRLVKMFPLIRREFPDVKLHVFSSMKVYQQDPSQDEREYGYIYDQCRSIDGIELIGSLSQVHLAQRLKPVSILAYPNTFPETSCISVLEAMSAGCHIITSNLGALPETASGFGELIECGIDENIYIEEFSTKILERLAMIYSRNVDGMDDVLARQVFFTNYAYSWKKRADEWELFLRENVLNL